MLKSILVLGAACLVFQMVAPANAATERVLYAFKNGSDGALPVSPLIDVGGVFYGTTEAGGPTHSGTVFAVTRAGVERVVYAFNGGSDGSLPRAGLIDDAGTLYGTTAYGGGTGCGGGGCGTVFSVTPDGTEKIVYAFQGGDDGYQPGAKLLRVGGRFYGTTTAGGGTGCGGSGCGTVFWVTPQGDEKVIYAFAGGSDGAEPENAGVIDVGGTFYGTTVNGGGGTGCGDNGCGTVYAVTAAGHENVVYAFSGGVSFPYGGVIDVGGVLYGTTDSGAFYSVTTAGVENTLHFFDGGSDGSNPYSGLIDMGGTLYGTTDSGGGSGCNGEGCGTVYAVTTTGAESVVYAFQGGNDGAGPQAALIDVGGVLYGTTVGGGGQVDCFDGGSCGTVFKVKP
jgi:uncharacterized repeat protein (TIGR03803 family)